VIGGRFVAWIDPVRLPIEFQHKQTVRLEYSSAGPSVHSGTLRAEHGDRLQNEGKLEQAKAEYDRVISLYAKCVVEEHGALETRLVKTLAKRAIMFIPRASYPEAIQDFGRVIDLCQRLDKTEIGMLAWSLDSRGRMFDRLNRSDEARADFDQVVAIYERLVAEERILSLTSPPSRELEWFAGRLL
jgi:tetratricopeptide (TPR) repeat protein